MLKFRLIRFQTIEIRSKQLFEHFLVPVLSLPLLAVTYKSVHSRYCIFKKAQADKQLAWGNQIRMIEKSQKRFVMFYPAP